MGNLIFGTPATPLASDNLGKTPVTPLVHFSKRWLTSLVNIFLLIHALHRCHTPVNPFCGTLPQYIHFQWPPSHALGVSYLCGTLSQGSSVRDFRQPAKKLLPDTLVGRSCRTTLTPERHSCGTLLLVTVAGHWTLMQDSFVRYSCKRHACKTLSRDTLEGDTLAGHSLKDQPFSTLFRDLSPRALLQHTADVSDTHVGHPSWKILA